MFETNYEAIETHLLNFIRDSIHKNNFKNGILGVSGGVDSAVVLALTKRALGSNNTFALLMPYRLSSKDSLIHARQICDQLNVAYDIVDISTAVDSYFEKFPTDNKVLIGNKCARERMSVLYDFSARKKALVVGTSNKSELLVGYSTIYGDSAAAFFPIGDLYKTQVKAFGEYLGIPQEILRKIPSADLWEDQTDEDELGISYKELDEILYLLIDIKKKESDIKKMGYSENKLKKIKQMIVQSQYKRTIPPIPKIHNRTIGIDFRYSRDWYK